MEFNRNCPKEILIQSEETLPREFYARDTLEVAEELPGKYLCRKLKGVVMIGRIVEVEAYKGNDDPASYAYKGKTPRSQLMFERAGIAFVYLIYGKYHCFNITTEEEEVPGAVLIRALEPIIGISLMKQNRKSKDLTNLTSGPGKLTQALNITMEQGGLDLTSSKELFVFRPNIEERLEIVSSTRIGTKQDIERKWRFYIKNNNFISK